MSVVFVIDGLGTGGAQRSLAESLPHLVAEGIRPVVVCLSHKEEGVEADVVAAGFDVRVLDRGSLLHKLRQLRKIVSEERPDIVHTALFNSDILGRLAAVRSGARVVTSLVNTQYGEQRRRDTNVPAWKLRAVIALDGITSRHLTAHFHAVSESVVDDAVAALKVPRDRITVVQRSRDPARLGLPTPERRRSVRRSVGIDDSAEVLINVGRQEFSKGQRHLLEAFELAAPQHPHAVLLLAGRPGNSSAELEELRRRSAVADRIRFLGHRDDVPDLLAASDVFVFPSLYEGFPGAVLEALALALPVVGSDIPTIRQVFDDESSAVLVPAQSSIALADAISAILTDPARRAELGSRGRELFLRRYGVRETSARMVEIYRRVLALQSR